MSLGRVCWSLVIAIACGQAAWGQSTIPVEGLRSHTPAVHALINARLVIAPGRVVERGTVVVRDGLIEAAGDVAVPADARIWNLEGKTIYAGLIDAYGEKSIDAAVAKRGAPYWNALIAPQVNVADHYQSDTELDKKLREQGITVRLIAPATGIIKGTSALVLTGTEPQHQSILRRHAAQHVRLTIPRGRGRESYPNSPMGAVALARQALLDAAWYRQAWAAYRSNTTLPRPELNDALETLQAYSDKRDVVIADAPDELFVLRADQFAREFSLNIAIRGSGHEYKRVEAIAQTGRTIILPLEFPKPPNVSSAEAALNVNLDELMHWEFAPENPARLEQAGIKIVFTSQGLSDPASFLSAVRKAIERGLPAEAALRALTTTPAELFQMSDRLGTIERGKLANLLVTDGDLFAKKTNVVETWVNGRRYEVVREPLFDVLGRWKVTLADESPSLLIELTGEPTKLSGTIRKTDGEAKEIKLSRVGLQDARLSCTFAARELGGTGISRLTAVIEHSADKSLTWLGHITLADGKQIAITATREAGEAAEDTAKPKEDAESKESSGDSPTEAQPEAPIALVVNFPLGAFGREQPPTPPAAVVFQHATVWTCGKAGVLEDASVLVVNGRIQAVGQKVVPPAGALMVDATGKHITPGIIDCHSHMATDGGINESTQAITAEVRIGDFIDADDINIYRQLAGGVTSANILHGSANPIGGQNQVIKLRWGALPEAMKFAEAPAGIKFALGENVKQSNWGDDHTTRYPQSRMGVEQIIRDAFQAARQYRQQQLRWQRTRDGLPPRVDLELEALAEILEGSRWIHCHSYRQDEILALLRTLDEFQIRIGSLQHILEGYKVAEVMAKHGAMGSAFSDWWAYKFEVFDAIPYAGALMHHAGVNVSFNSDDAELARHLNQEAAKAVKYGGVDPVEALKFVTLNPAKQLRIDQHVGSLERGKHADLVVWSGPPLSILARVEQTWIDGHKYFDVQEDQQLRTSQQILRQALVQKVLSSGEKMKSDEETSREESELWPRIDIFCHGHDHGSH